MVYQRRHVEVLDTSTLAWTPFRVPGLPDGLRQRELSRDPGDGATTCIVDIPSGWRCPGPWALSTAFDAFVLSGTLAAGDSHLTRHWFGYFPAGYPLGESSTHTGARMLLMTYGRAVLRRPDHAQLRNPAAVPWRDLATVPVRQPLTDKVGMGLVSQTLRLDHHSGERVFVISVEAGGFRDDRIEWHPCVEEIYQIEGETSMDHPGDTLVLRPGCYCYRPPGIPHGPFATLRQPKLAIVRVDKTLVNNYCSQEEARRLWRSYPDELDPQVAARIGSAGGAAV